MKFIDNLNNILCDLEDHKQEQDKHHLFMKYVNKRLNQSLYIYYYQLCQSIRCLMSKEEIRILRSLNRYNK